MAIYYVDDGGDNTTGATWATAYNTLVSGLAATSAGDTVYIGSDHSEQLSGNTTYTGAGTAASPVNIISADRTSGEPPTIFETMTTGGGKIDGKTAGFYDINFAGTNIWNGLKFIAGDDINFININAVNIFYNILFVVDDNMIINAGNSTDVGVQFYNVDYQLATTGYIDISGPFVWKGGTFSFNGGSTTHLLKSTKYKVNMWEIADVDFQDLDASDTFMYLSSDSASHIKIKRCKIPAALGTLFLSANTIDNIDVKFHSVSSANIIYQFQENYFTGQINEDTAIYFNATYNGTNGYSAKMATNSNAIEWSRPLRFKLAEVWAAANPTLAVELVLDSATALNNDDFWLEIEYPDSTTGALGKIDKSSRMTDILDTPAALTASSVSWTGTSGFTNEQKRKITETLTNGQAGIHTIWAVLAKPSITIYVDPKITVT
ncbi:MAG: hypothetical protein U9R60_09625 [Bacteroidota bacterium]|nr:hypothetical protein [Bacteroidota bacterium]